MFVRTLNMQQLFGIPTSEVSLTTWRASKSLPSMPPQETGKKAMIPLLKIATYPPWNSDGISWSYLFCTKYSMVMFHFHLHVARRTLQRNLRNSSSIQLQRPPVHIIVHHYSFFPHAIALWNRLPTHVQKCESVTTFKRSLLSLNIWFDLCLTLST